MAPNPHNRRIPKGSGALARNLGVVALSLTLDLSSSSRQPSPALDPPNIDARLTEQTTDRFPADGRDSQSPPDREVEKAVLYRRLRAYHHAELAHTHRDDMPQLMRVFRPPPSPDNEHLLIDWQAERDALVDRAMALAYVVGELKAVVSGTRYWNATADARMGTTAFTYPVDGEVSRRSPAPKNGDGVLVTRGWAVVGPNDTEPRPHHPIPPWFLPSHATG